LFEFSWIYVHKYEFTPKELLKEDQRNIIYDLLLVLKHRYLHGPYSCLTFVLNSLYSVLKKDQRFAAREPYNEEYKNFAPLPIGFFPTEEYFDSFFSETNLDFIQHFIDSDKHDIIVWSYLFTFHNFFMKNLETIEKSAGFNRSYKTYIATKLNISQGYIRPPNYRGEYDAIYEEPKLFDKWITVCTSDEFEGFCVCFFKMYNGIRELSNIDQIIKDEDFGFMFELLMYENVKFRNYFLRIVDEDESIKPFVPKPDFFNEDKAIDVIDFKPAEKEKFVGNEKEKTKTSKNPASMSKVHRGRK
jgi:hypothetical protein